MTDASRLTATEAARDIAAGKLTATKLMEDCLAQIAARDGEVRAFANIDPDLALRTARAVDAGKLGGKPGKSLAGIPVGVKDVIDTADLPTEYNSPLYKGHRPRTDAACVAATRAAGGIIIGKTVTTEFATRFPGPTRNPRNLAHTPGGSSQGSAAGLGANFFPLAFGTQTAGSIVRPAAFCGVVGFKPTFGAIHRGGMRVISESLDTIGVMTRSVADCALFMGALNGRDYGDPSAKPARAPKIGLCRSPVWDKAQPETVALMERAAAALAKAGAKVSEVALSPAFGDIVEAQTHLSGREGFAALRHEFETAPHMLSETLRTRTGNVTRQPLERYDWALQVQKSCRDAFAAAIGDVDVLVTPSAMGEAPKGIEATGDPIFNTIWTVLHVPCITVPAGTGPQGLPLGIQIVGRMNEDKAVLAWAEWVRQAVG